MDGSIEGDKNRDIPGYELLTEFEITGQPARKSNSRRIVKNKKTNKPLLIKSEVALNYTSEFLSQVPAEAKQRFGGLDKPLALYVVVYYKSRRPDLSIELIMDLLEKSGVVQNDRYIREQRAWGFVDKKNPRIRLRLYSLPQDRVIPF
jgi:Holliday junction resolvase RusA-like endonuclease